MKRVLVALLAVVILLVLAPGFLAEGPATDRSGRAEVRFLEGMIDHHQMALDMAADCLNKAATELVRTLCQNIIDAQTKEILGHQDKHDDHGKDDHGKRLNKQTAQASEKQRHFYPLGHT